MPPKPGVQTNAFNGIVPQQEDAMSTVECAMYQQVQA
jgi:hypothetical protein